MKKRKEYKAVFRAKINFQYDDEKLGKTLLPGHNYSLDEYPDQKTSYDDIVDKSVRIINNEFKSELQKYTDIPIGEVKVQSVYEGSIDIIFTVVISFLELVAGLKDLYDVVNLIREISERHINKGLNNTFGRHFQVDTYVIVPEYRDPRRFEENTKADQRECSVEKRDVFFYYLLIANIVLLIIVGVLVFGAVRAVYFN